MCLWALHCFTADRTRLSHLVDVELLYEVQVGAFPAQMSLSQNFNPLLLQAVHHIIVGVLIREPSQSLKSEKTSELVFRLLY